MLAVRRAGVVVALASHCARKAVSGRSQSWSGSRWCVKEHVAARLASEWRDRLPAMRASSSSGSDRSSGPPVAEDSAFAVESRFSLDTPTELCCPIDGLP
jgi:hypothetical protein